MCFRKIGFAVVALALTSCVTKTPQLDDGLEAKKLQQFEEKLADKAAYREGEGDGRSDAVAGLGADPSRHALAKTNQKAHADGYHVGYGSVQREGTAKLPPEHTAARDAGFESGLEDKINGRERDPLRHQDKYEPAMSEAFLQGYDAGFKSE
jgi:hypothetical protein